MGDSTTFTDDRSADPDAAGRPTDVSTDPRLVQWDREHRGPLIAYAKSLLHGDSAAAEDAVQETFLRLCRADLDAIANRIRPWLFRVCRTRVIDMQRTKHSVAVDPGDWDIAADCPPPDQALIDAEAETDLAERIDKLSPRQREVLRLRFSGGMSYREISEVTGASVAAVGVHLHQAMFRLRKSLHPSG